MLFASLSVGGGAQESDTGCGLSSSGMSELALFQELHSYSTIHTGHSTVLVPLAVVMGKGRIFRTVWVTTNGTDTVGNDRVCANRMTVLSVCLYSATPYPRIALGTPTLQSTTPTAKRSYVRF